MISPISSSAITSFTDEITTTAPSIPLEDKVKQLFAEYSASVSKEKADLIDKASNIDASNPKSLLDMQNQVGNYNLAMSMVSTLTHKTVSAIDTVLKAQ